VERLGGQIREEIGSVAEGILHLTKFTQGLGSTQAPTHLLQRAVCAGVNRPGRVTALPRSAIV